MPLPDLIRKAWDNRKGPIVFATVDQTGLPNIIYATCVASYGDDRIIIADNYFDKTRTNILAGCQGSILFITEDDQAIQLKGSIEYHSKGELYQDMKKWNPTNHPGHAAAVLKVQSAYSGAKKLV